MSNNLGSLFYFIFFKIHYLHEFNNFTLFSKVMFFKFKSYILKIHISHNFLSALQKNITVIINHFVKKFVL